MGYGSLSKYHKDHPFKFGDRTLGYEPGEAEVKLKGGNSNWARSCVVSDFVSADPFIPCGSVMRWGPQFSVQIPGDGREADHAFGDCRGKRLTA